MGGTDRETRTDRLLQDPAFLTRARDRARALLAYIDRCPTPYHAVAETARQLEAAGFVALDERAPWTLEAGSRAYVTRSGSSILAFQVGRRSPAEAGFTIVGAHTDSPNLKLKPRASYERHGYRQLGVEVYGGVLLHTWFDRDLSVAGRVAVRTGAGVQMRLVDLGRPVARVSNLAIHLNRGVNKDGFKVNEQTQLPPIIGLALGGEKDGEGRFLTELLAKELAVGADEILEHDLSLYDVQKGSFAGLDESLICVARLDNLASCHAALAALLEVAGSAGDATRVVALYDHEEVGSRSAQGAAGPFLEAVLRRIVAAHPEAAPQAFERAAAASFLVSADMAHAVHPNYADRHEPQHMPMIGRGPAVKTNANQSYATDGESAARFIALCQEAGFDPQSFVTRTDQPCGSTIGPITAARIGVKTVDVGSPMLSMHSIREVAGTADTELMHRALVQLFRAP